MREEKPLLCNGSIIGFIKGYYEDEDNYIFIIDGKDVKYSKKDYELSNIFGNYTLTECLPFY